MSSTSPPCAPRRAALRPFAVVLVACVAAATTDARQDDGRKERAPAHIGFYAREWSELAQPVAVAIAEDGTVAIVEAASASLALFAPHSAGPRRIPLRGAGRLVEPAGVAFGPERRVYWTDANGARVHAFDRGGEALLAFGKPGLGPGELHRPRGLDVSGGRVAVADAGNHRVELYDLEGEHLLTIGEHGRGEGRFVRPADVAFGPDGLLFVADEGNARIQVFDAEGRFVRAWGDFGPFPGLFAGPTAVDVAASRVYVCDRGNHRVQVFDARGEHVYEWGEHAVLPLQGEGKMQYPEGLAVSAGGDLAVIAEPGDDRAQVFVNDQERSTGERLVPRPGPAAISSHYGTEVAADGDWLAIPAPEDGTVLLFETSWDDPRLVAHVGERGDGYGLFLRPEGVHLDAASGVLTVTDLDQRRLSLFRLSAFEGGQVGYDAFLWRFVKALDFARLFDALPPGTLEAVPDPGAVTRDADGRFYVCDLRNDCVLVLDAELGFERALRGEAGELRRPTGVALAPGGRSLLVVESGNARLWSIDLGTGASRNGWSWSFTLPADAPAGTRAPRLHGIVSDGESVFVTDAGRDQLLVFELEAAGGESRFPLAAEHGTTGLGRLEFREPRGLAIDGKGQLVVLDHANHRGHVLTRSGEFLDVFGSRPFLEPALFPGRRSDAPVEED